jgi:hypothetical protein
VYVVCEKWVLQNMTIDQAVSEYITPVLQNKDAEGYRAMYDDIQNVVVNAKRSVSIVDLMKNFNYIPKKKDPNGRMVDYVFTWRDFIQYLCDFVRFCHTKFNPKAHMHVVVISVDRILKSQARSFVSSSRHANKVERTIPGFTFANDDAFMDDPLAFPYPNNGAATIPWSEAYAQRPFRLDWLYPICVKYLPSMLINTFSHNFMLPPQVILSGFTNEYTFHGTEYIAPTQTVPYPVENDFQMISWSLYFLKLKWFVVMTTQDGDMFMAVMIQIDRIKEEHIDIDSVNNWWWYRNVPKNYGLIHNYSMYKRLTECVAPEYPRRGMMISMLLFSHGTDYVNVKVTGKARLDQLNLGMELEKLKLKDTKWLETILFENTVNGHHIIDVDTEEWALFLSGEYNKKINSQRYVFALQVAAQCAWSCNYYKMEPIKNGAVIPFVTLVGDKSYFGFVDGPNGIESTTDVVIRRKGLGGIPTIVTSEPLPAFNAKRKSPDSETEENEVISSSDEEEKSIFRSINEQQRQRTEKAFGKQAIRRSPSPSFPVESLDSAADFTLVDEPSINLHQIASSSSTPGAVDVAKPPKPKKQKQSRDEVRKRSTDIMLDVDTSQRIATASFVAALVDVHDKYNTPKMRVGEFKLNF